MATDQFAIFEKLMPNPFSAEEKRSRKIYINPHQVGDSMNLIKRMAKKFPKFSESQSFTTAMTNRNDDSIQIEAHTVDESPSLILHIDDAKYAKEVAKSLSSFGATISVFTQRKIKTITIIDVDHIHGMTKITSQDEKYAILAKSLTEYFGRNGYWFIK